ncbi:MAG: hypothetical protein OXQ29_17835 [Rhodospirillaceae bacterium]|nr:hypothetical protein [Rhodospirillaceae bacterium]
MKTQDEQELPVQIGEQGPVHGFVSHPEYLGIEQGQGADEQSSGHGFQVVRKRRLSVEVLHTVKRPVEGGSDGGADLGDGPLAADRPPGADADGRGQRGLHRNLGSYASAAKGHSLHPVGQSTGFPGAEVDQDADDQPAGVGYREHRQRGERGTVGQSAAPGHGLDEQDQFAECDGASRAQHADQYRGN